MSERWTGVGKRKTSVARIIMTKGSGKIEVNGKEVSEFFKRETAVMILKQPFDLVKKRNQFDIVANVAGGGIMGQADAVKFAISRALLAYEADLRGDLKKAGFLTCDARRKERKKPGQPKARKRFQFSKR